MSEANSLRASFGPVNRDQRDRGRKPRRDPFRQLPRRESAWVNADQGLQCASRALPDRDDRTAVCAAPHQGHHIEPAS